MNTLKDYVEWKLTHSDKVAEAEGYPLVLENCKRNKQMKQLKVYGNSVQDGTPTPENPVEVQGVGELVTDETDVNYGKYKIPIVQRGKNVLDLTKRSYSNASTQQTLDNGIIVKGSVSSSTSPTLSSKGWLLVGRKSNINYIKNKVGTKITISFDVTLQQRLDDTVAPQTVILLNQITVSPTYKLELGVKKHFSCTFTPKSTWEDLYFVICLCSQVLKLENIQVEYGDTETTYEPHVEPITHNVFLDGPLRKIGDSADYIDFKTQKVMRKIGAKIFDGTENWMYEKLSYGNNFYTSISNSVTEHSSVVYSNIGSHYTNGSLANAYAVRISTSGNLNYRYQDYDNLTDFKNKLAEMYANGEPFYIVYRLKSETKEDISCQLPKIITKTTVFETDTDVKPSNMYGKYIK